MLPRCVGSHMACNGCGCACHGSARVRPKRRPAVARPPSAPRVKAHELVNAQHAKVLSEAGWSARKIARLFKVDPHTVLKVVSTYEWSDDSLMDVC